MPRVPQSTSSASPHRAPGRRWLAARALAARGLAARTTFLLVALAVPVYPCGGPEFYEIDAPLLTADAHLQAVEVVDDFDFRPRAELRFLYPFLAAGTPRASAMWSHAYADGAWNRPAKLDTLEALSLDGPVAAFERAGGRGDARELSRTARALVDAALDLPAVVADEYQPSVRRAVEALELLAAPGGASALTPAVVQRLYSADSLPAPDMRALPALAQEALTVRALARDSLPAWGEAHPQSARAGSLRFVALQLAMKRGIPDGWAHDIRDSVPAERWRDFSAMHDAWMRRFPQHPLAPWVTLSRLRLAFLAGDTATAWNTALAMYGAHPPRALDEMRYLLRQSMYPPSLDDPRIDDVLRAALLGEVRIDGERWRREWDRAATASAPWAFATRDRLMWHAARDSTNALRLPPASLRAPAAALTPLGGVLRLVALVRAGRISEAIAQADSLGRDSLASDSLVAPMRIQLLLAARRWRDALDAPGIDPSARQYLVRVLAPIRCWCRSRVAATPCSRSRRGAPRPRVSRRSGRGAPAPRPWGRASRRRPRRGDASNRSRPTARSPVDSPLRATCARTEVVLGNDKVWYRSLNWRLRSVGDTVYRGFNPILPWSADDETRAIGRHFRDGFEMYHAIKGYADFLARAPRSDARRAAALREANLTYNWLVNWDNNNSPFWADALEAEGIGRTIRQAGRR
ncbi:MAG: hypothetical protein IPF47_11470 [Gemmatimonadetes bacterium]|nr:hypothetical protein [Gemmatimonadota bacterium]